MPEVNDKPHCYVHFFAGTQTSHRMYRLEKRIDYSKPFDEKGYPFALKEKPSTDNEYADFETLNLLYSLVNGGEEIPPDVLEPLVKPKKYSACCSLAAWREHSGYVVGVNDIATNIGENIVNHLLCLLNAIQRGHNKLFILGHSRGAAAAFPVLHDLNRVLLHSQKDVSLYKVLMQTPCQYTQNALIKLTLAQKEWLERHERTIFKALETLEVSVFLLDPVPGDGLLSPKKTMVGWVDERFNIIPKIVSHIEICYANDERTKLFRPIISSPEAHETQYTETWLPGHHGTMIGNLRTHNGNDGEEHKREHVQKIVLLKALHAMHSQGVQLHQFIPMDWLNEKETYQKTLLSLYDAVQKNLSAYSCLRDNSMLINGFFGSFFRESRPDDKGRVLSMSTTHKSRESTLPKGLVNTEHQYLRETLYPSSTQPFFRVGQ